MLAYLIQSCQTATQPVLAPIERPPPPPPGNELCAPQQDIPPIQYIFIMASKPPLENGPRGEPAYEN